MARNQDSEGQLPRMGHSLIVHGKESNNAAQANVLSYPEDGDEKCMRVFGFTPKPEQRKVVEHIGRGEDCILIAGCGWGKTLVCFLPLVLWESRIIVIISPLVALMEEQYAKLQAVNISSIPIHSGRQLPHSIEEELIDGKYRAIFMSPESAFGVRFGMLWSEAGWRSRLQAVVIDEAHCISTWGPEFRVDYDRIGELRSKIPPGAAFVAVSATLHGNILQDVKRSLHFDSNVAVIRADTDRPNVRYEVHVTNGAIETCYQGLEAFLDSKKTIVYFDNINELMHTYRHLCSKIHASTSASEPPFPRPEQIATYFSDLTTATKLLYMSRFKSGKICMLLSTDAAGMGCDIPDILRVVQFRIPKSITVLAQRLGRAARGPNIQGVGILIYPRTDSQKLKNIEANLHDYLKANCLRRHFNSVFENEHKTVDNCCDRCDVYHPTPLMPDYRMVRNTPLPSLSRKYKVTRPHEQQLVAKEKIMSWRSTEFQYLKTQAMFYTEECIMNEEYINLLSVRFGDIAIAGDINAVLDWSELVKGSQQRLTDILVEYNREIDDTQRQQHKRQNPGAPQNEGSQKRSK